ncbi:SAM-dependent methyltransferase [Actinophytocola sp.]|uniref:SAM-dependent methyltransferase n=1 Tax=Actinophytocola sp. TaxID=1872138 RepID=UPI00389AC2AC
MGQELRGIGRTALWVAMMRAAEGGRPDRLFDDRLASAFVAATGLDTTDAMRLPPGANEFLAVRTHFYDQYLLDACAAGLRQVVLLAAGLDSRAFRLAWPAGTRFFELDLPEVFQFKETVLAAHGAVAGCARTAVPADLRGDWPERLRQAGFDPVAPTAWLAEGLLVYLPQADNDRLVGALTARSAPGSRFAFDHMESAASGRAAVREVAELARNMDARFRSSLDDPVAWLAAHGWGAAVDRIPALAESYGRTLPPEVDLVASNANILCTATR